MNSNLNSSFSYKLVSEGDFESAFEPSVRKSKGVTRISS